MTWRMPRQITTNIYHGTFDPHAWQSLGDTATYVDNITAALAQADPVNAADFYQNRASYELTRGRWTLLNGCRH